LNKSKIGPLFLMLPVKRDTRGADYLSDGFRCKISLFCFSQNSVMDIGGFLNGGKNEKGKDQSSENYDPLKKL